MISAIDKSKLSKFTNNNITDEDTVRTLPKYMNFLMMDLYVGKNCKLSTNANKLNMQKILLKLHLIVIKGENNLRLTKQGIELCKRYFYPKPELKKLIHHNDVMNKIDCYVEIGVFLSGLSFLPFGILYLFNYKFHFLPFALAFIDRWIALILGIISVLLFLSCFVDFCSPNMSPSLTDLDYNTIWTTHVFKLIDKYCQYPKKERINLVNDLKQYSIDDYD